ncbi:hypothetical protein Q4489_15370 [Thalassotalea sp. 1_MG-2023]|uniref:hypothetical protein n=1 Tax=Thalassotalea sp. 1_MG-2023 TaxID=3062680 RepID=UPI0026E23C4F|nr:hypothetical protein [Thalassotalea sp. 1_MG-2023]MDO6428395.1 hypothetical protein [Thalassotalea sp. 1_MG-2023]
MLVAADINALFKRYLAGFIQQDLAVVASCYQTPCTLTTPEEMQYIVDDAQLECTLLEIFSQLSVANVAEIKVPYGSFDNINTELALVCLHWQFIDQSQQTFAEFCAFYHIESTSQGKAKIRHVISHDLSELKHLSTTINIGNN